MVSSSFSLTREPMEAVEDSVLAASLALALTSLFLVASAS